ncbi:hypothetical protein R3W88_004536 [Solanum pinnatisectum]|uniref:Uncharacterized protein n=1 Tax=Solanum pinnatisectum TaxID=50273 RepID=A0AAV9KAX1_9SOLN|nr:hypothetical protein R3W88_004536 [Solanum pinnatisectum]
MEKLREEIVKISNIQHNVPLFENQNLHKHLNRFLFMIEKVLNELDEEGDSNEDTLYEFIKKEYDSLPRAHMTLLKHHLQKMFEKGEVHLEQPIKHCRGRLAKYKKDGAKINDSTISKWTTKEPKDQSVRELSRARRIAFIEILHF